MDWRSGKTAQVGLAPLQTVIYTSCHARNYNCFFHGSDRNPTWLSLTIHKISSSNSNALRRSRLDILDISSHRPTILTSVGIAASNAWAKGKTYSTSRASILIHFLQLSTGSIYVKIFRFKMMALVTDGNSDVFFFRIFCYTVTPQMVDNLDMFYLQTPWIFGIIHGIVSTWEKQKKSQDVIVVLAYWLISSTQMQTLTDWKFDRMASTGNVPPTFSLKASTKKRHQTQPRHTSMIKRTELVFPIKRKGRSMLTIFSTRIWPFRKESSRFFGSTLHKGTGDNRATALFCFQKACPMDPWFLRSCEGSKATNSESMTMVLDYHWSRYRVSAIWLNKKLEKLIDII